MARKIPSPSAWGSASQRSIRIRRQPLPIREHPVTLHINSGWSTRTSVALGISLQMISPRSEADHNYTAAGETAWASDAYFTLYALRLMIPEVLKRGIRLFFLSMLVRYRGTIAHLRTIARTQTHTQLKFCARIFASQRTTPPILEGWMRSFNLSKLGVPDALHRLHCIGVPRKFCGCIHASPRARGGNSACA